eukprot:2848384-Alexandrium_andersonii.AAC.1
MVAVLTEASVAPAFDALVAARAALQPLGGNGEGGGGGNAAVLVEQLRALVAAAVGGASAEGRAGGAA